MMSSFKQACLSAMPVSGILRVLMHNVSRLLAKPGALGTDTSSTLAMTAAKRTPEGVLVVSKNLAERVRPKDGSVCISIGNPNQEPANLDANFEAVLRLDFHDATRPDSRFVPMSLEQAQSILEFCHRYRDRLIVVHCEAGASRSVAVGLFVSTWLKKPMSMLVDVLTPNNWVVNQLRIAALPFSWKWRDIRLTRLAVQGPYPFRFEVLPSALASTYHA